MDIRDKLAAFKAEQEMAPARRAALIEEARAQEPPITWREIARILDMTEHGVYKAAEKARREGTHS